MIVVDIKLVSAISEDRSQDLGVMIIANDGVRSIANSNRGDYEARMYKKNDLKRLGSYAALSARGKPTRTAKVLNHARHAEPVQNLVAKALKEMGYE